MLVFGRPGLDTWIAGEGIGPLLYAVEWCTCVTMATGGGLYVNWELLAEFGGWVDLTGALSALSPIYLHKINNSKRQLEN